MSLSEAELREYLAAWNAHDADRVVAYFTDDATYEDVAMGQVNTGKDQIREFAAAMFRSMPDMNVELVSLCSAGDWVASEWVMTGTQTEDSILGVPATGKPFRIRGASVGEIAEDKIKRISDYWNLASLLQQLGLLPGA